MAGVRQFKYLIVNGKVALLLSGHSGLSLGRDTSVHAVLEELFGLGLVFEENARLILILTVLVLLSAHRYRRVQAR